MGKTTQDQRDYTKQLADQVTEDIVPLSRRLAYGLALDADRLARAEALLRECGEPMISGTPSEYEIGKRIDAFLSGE